MYLLSLLTIVSEHVPPMIIYISNSCVSISIWGILGYYCLSVSVSVFFEVVVLTLILKCSLVLNFSRACITVMADWALKNIFRPCSFGAQFSSGWYLCAQ